MTFDTLSNVNYLAALVAAVAFFVLGAIWHAPRVLGRAWQRASGVAMEGAFQPSPVLFVANFVAYFIGAVVTAALAVATGSDTWMEGLVLGLFVAIGYVLTSTAVVTLYERKPIPAQYFFINGVYNALGAIIVAVIVSVWR
jgi:hypothetical protein